MSITFLSSKDYPSGQIIEFNIESAKDDKYKDIKAINDVLAFQEEISFGKIFKRQDNGDFWYINPNATIARFISNDQLDLFHKWDKEDLLPSDLQFQTLNDIGGLPSSKYLMVTDFIQFPALITTKSGQQIDLCLFHFSKAPPFQRHFKKVILLNDIADIKPSELALSHELRLSSMLADEIRMSFYPFMVCTNTGKIITYNGITQFASDGQLKGSDIICEVPFSYYLLDKIYDVSYDDITFVIGKWDIRLEELFKNYSEKLEKMNNTPGRQ